jgi:hypothetical protein
VDVEALHLGGVSVCSGTLLCLHPREGFIAQLALRQSFYSVTRDAQSVVTLGARISKCGQVLRASCTICSHPLLDTHSDFKLGLEERYHRRMTL